MAGAGFAAGAGFGAVRRQESAQRVFRVRTGFRSGFSCRQVRRGNGLDDFPALDRHPAGRLNAYPNTVAAAFQNRDDDPVADHDLFARLACKYQHPLNLPFAARSR